MKNLKREIIFSPIHLEVIILPIFCLNKIHMPVTIIDIIIRRQQKLKMLGEKKRKDSYAKQVCR